MIENSNTYQVANTAKRKENILYNVVLFVHLFGVVIIFAAMSSMLHANWDSIDQQKRR